MTTFSKVTGYDTIMIESKKEEYYVVREKIN